MHALFVLLALSAVVRSQIVTVPLRRQFSPLLDLGSLLPRHKDDAPAINQAVQLVTAVTTGNDQTFPNVLVDTGSAALWVNAGQTKYEPGPHAKTTNDTFTAGYGAGAAQGAVYLDQVIIGSARVKSQYVGAATTIEGFTSLVNIDGILGLGRTVGNNHTISNHSTTPTFVDSLYDEHVISKRTLGIYIKPITGNDTEDTDGEITFGGVDQSRFKGEVTYVPQNTDNSHWAVNVSDFMYGTTSLSAAVSEAIVDTGTLPILLPFTAYFTLRNLTNGTIYNDGPLAGFLSVPPNTTLFPVNFTIGGALFSLPPNAWLIPQDLYGMYNVTGENLPTWFASGGFGNAALGQKFLEEHYSVFDSDNDRIGFASRV